MCAQGNVALRVRARRLLNQIWNDVRVSMTDSTECSRSPECVLLRCQVLERDAPVWTRLGTECDETLVPTYPIVPW
jgi:hypothetical protein